MVDEMVDNKHCHTHLKVLSEKLLPEVQPLKNALMCFIQYYI